MTVIRNSILAGLAFGCLIGIFFAFRFSTEQAIIAGPISGIAFGIAIYLFVTSKMVKRQTEIKNIEGKTVIHSGGANHFLNGEAVGGKLYLLTDRLEFKSHNFNIQNHEFAIDLKQIKYIQFFNTLGLIPNGLEIHTMDGRIEKFVVGGRKQWKNELEKLKNWTL
jgi:hypothetical protein